MPRKRSRIRPAAVPPAAIEAPASIETVSRLAGVSKATVSRVMNGITEKVSETTRRRVLRAIESSDYRPSRAGSILRRGRSHLVGVLIPDAGSAYNASVTAAVEQVLREQGKVMVLGNTGESAAVQDSLLREMRSLQVAGVVMLGAVKSAELEACLSARMPVVFVNRQSPARLRGPFVGIDNVLAGREVARYLAGRGHRDVCLLHGPLGSSATHGRVSGFVAEYEKQAKGAHCTRLSLDAGDRKREGYEKMARLLAERQSPEAVFCTTDEIAYGVAKCCREHGLRIPNDIEVVGFDGSPLNAYLAPWLTTVSVPYDEFGPAVAGVLNALWTEDTRPPSDVVFPFRLIISPNA